MILRQKPLRMPLLNQTMMTQTATMTRTMLMMPWILRTQ